MKPCCNQKCSQGRSCPNRTLDETTLLEKISKWLKSVWNTWLERLGAKILRSLLHFISFVFITLWGAATIFFFLAFGMLFYGMAKDALLPFLKPLLAPLIKLLGSL